MSELSPTVLAIAGFVLGTLQLLILGLGGWVLNTLNTLGGKFERFEGRLEERQANNLREFETIKSEVITIRERLHRIEGSVSLGDREIIEREKRRLRKEGKPVDDDD